MKVKRFEDIIAWQKGHELTIFAFKCLINNKDFTFRNQFFGALYSITNNIAEGFERGTTQELLTFLYIARGSAGEVRSMLCLLEGMDQLTRPEFSNLKSEISDLKSQAESISRQLRAWAESLQNTSIKGQRYLDDKTRRREQAARDREEFLKELADSRRTGR